MHLKQKSERVVTGFRHRETSVGLYVERVVDYVMCTEANSMAPPPKRTKYSTRLLSPSRKYQVQMLTGMRWNDEIC